MKKRDKLHVWKPHKTTIDNRTVFLREHVLHEVHSLGGNKLHKPGTGARKHEKDLKSKGGDYENRT